MFAVTSKFMDRTRSRAVSSCQPSAINKDALLCFIYLVKVYNIITSRNRSIKNDPLSLTHFCSVHEIVVSLFRRIMHAYEVHRTKAPIATSGLGVGC